MSIDVFLRGLPETETDW